MVQSVFPLTKTEKSPAAPRKGRSLGVELALPLTLLAFILVSEQSPMLKLHLERIVDWLCDHDYVVTATTIAIACIPVWMLASMIYDRYHSHS